MCMESNIYISSALLSAQAFQTYITNTENAPSNATCEEDGMSSYPCERLTDIAEKCQQHSSTFIWHISCNDIRKPILSEKSRQITRSLLHFDYVKKY